MKFLVDVRIHDAAAAAPLLPAHMAYLVKHFDSGDFLLFGAYGDKTGGALIAKAASRSALDALLAADPLRAGSCAVWTVTEFTVAKVHGDKLLG